MTQPKIPTLEADRFYLRPVVPGDYVHLHMLETMPEHGPRWRFRGATVSSEHWAASFWEGALVQMLVIERDSNNVAGLVGVYRPNFQDGYAYLAAYRFERDGLSATFLLAAALFLRYVFACWPFRKLYIEVEEYNYEQFASGAARWFTVQGRLTDHTFLAGRYWDRVLLAVDRERAQQRLDVIARAVQGRSTEVTIRLP